VLEFIESNPSAFNGLFLFSLIWAVAAFYFGGRWAEAQFSDLKEQTVVFRERGASGHSKKSIFTRIGGASRALDVIVTPEELWIKGILSPFTFLGKIYNLTHRVSRTSIREVKLVGRSVLITFVSSAGDETSISLRLRQPSDFIRALTAKASL
jgi:hypothetical protein